MPEVSSLLMEKCCLVTLLRLLRQEAVKDEDLTAGTDGNALKVLVIFHFCNLSSRSSRVTKLCSAMSHVSGPIFLICRSGRISST